MGCSWSQDHNSSGQACTVQAKQAAINGLASNGGPSTRCTAGAEPAGSHPGHTSGPRAPGDDERVQLLRSLGIHDTPSTQQFDSITRLLCTVFNVPTALVSLTVAGQPSLLPGTDGRQGDPTALFESWTRVSNRPEVLVVPDALDDTRFCKSPLVLGEPHLRFYASCPLVAASGERYGSLHLIDTKPHPEFSTEQYNMLAQFAELAVREIEKSKVPNIQPGQSPFDPGGDAPLPTGGNGSERAAAVGPLPALLQLSSLQSAVQQHITQRNSGGPASPASSRANSVVDGTLPQVHVGALPGGPGGMMRVSEEDSGAFGEAGSPGSERQRLMRLADAMREGVALVDVRLPSWHILYTNQAFAVASGLPPDEATSQGFWDLFFTPGLGPEDFHSALGSAQPFTILVTLQSIYSATARTLLVDFRPASTAQQQLLNGSGAVSPGLPAPEEGQQHLYLAVLRERRAASMDGGSLGLGQHSMELASPLQVHHSHEALGAGSSSGPSQRFSDANTAASASQAGAGFGSGTWDHVQRLSPPGCGAPVAALQRPQGLGVLKQAMPNAFTDVKLGPLIGRGAYGRVYRGGWNGNIVAVKVVEYQEEVDANGEPLGTVAHARNAIFEAVLSSSLSHPNVVHTYQYAVRRTEPSEQDSGRTTPSPAPLSPSPSPVPPSPPPSPEPKAAPSQPPQQQAQQGAQQPQQQQQQQGQAQQSQQGVQQQQVDAMQPQESMRLSWETATTQQATHVGDVAAPAGSAAAPVQLGAPAAVAGASTAAGSWLLNDMALAQQGRRGGGAAAGRMVNCEVWLIQEFCNRGPLLSAVERGAFLQQPSPEDGRPNLISVLQTLQEVAAAMQYLHQHNVVHGDLTGGNVLLTTSDKDARGFTAKVVDFGLSRVCTEQYLRTRTLGCAEYMPPELITDGILTPAADVYAFGVLAWEVYVGRRAWDGYKPAEVLRKVANRARLTFPPSTPQRLKVLTERCMEYDPGARPSFTEVVSELNSVLADTLGILHRFLAASSAGGGAPGPAAAPGRTRQQPQQVDPFMPS